MGSQPPNDEDLCDHYLDFLVLTEIFLLLKEDPKLKHVDIVELQENILKKSKVIISTLNNCASSRLNSLGNKVEFVIIDEGNNEYKQMGKS